MENLEKICRLCLEKCHDNFEVIDELMKEVFNKLHLENNPAISEEPVVCSNCAEIIQKCFDFKSMCLSTRDYIAPFLNKNDEKLDLKDIYLSKEENKNVTEIPDDCTICAFCMTLSEGSFISLNDEEDVKMLKKCLPELDFRFIRNPVICTTCHGSLQNYFCFIINCSIVEEKIKKYCEDSCIKGLIKLSSMLQFMSINMLNMEGEHNTIDKIKVEEISVKTEKDIDEVDHQNVNFAEMSKNVLPLLSKSTLTCEEDDSKVSIVKIEEEICKEEEIEVHNEDQSFVEMKDEKFLTNVNEGSEIKTEQHDIVRIQDSILPQSEVAIKIRGRPKCCKLFQCEFCSYQTRYKRHFETHMLVHKSSSEVTMYQCEYCLFQTKYKNNLKKHLKGIHGNPTKENIYRCNSCSYKTSRKQFFKVHLLIHKESSEVKIYQCESCSYQTKHNYNLKQHLMIHKKPSKIIKMYQCETCSYQTKHNYALKKHLMVHKKPSETTMYQCEYCIFQSKYKNNLKKHLKGIHGNLLEVNVYRCATCTYQTKRRINLVNHLRLIHRNPTEGKIYQCKSCLYETSIKQFFEVHLLIHKKPSGMKIYQCESCSYQTEHNDRLKRHLMIHKKPSEITMYQCESCSYQTKYNYELKRHLVVHKKPSDITMYQCESCSFQTKYKGSLKKHLKGIHGNLLEVDMYRCATCSYQTKRKDNLVNHLRRIHRNPTEVKIYRCKSCLYKTNRKHLFKLHLRNHKKPSEIKIYQCESCSYQTKHNSILKRHLMIHKKPSEITMYQCEYCSFQTMYKTSVTNHLERQHGIRPEKNIYQPQSLESCKFAEKCEDHQHHMPTHKEPSKLQCLIKTNFKKIFEAVK